MSYSCFLRPNHILGQLLFKKIYNLDIVEKTQESRYAEFQGERRMKLRILAVVSY